MSALTAWSLVSLVIQMVTLAMLVYAFLHYKHHHDAKVHGAVTTVAYILNMVTIIFVMIPALFDSLADIGANPSEFLHSLILIHIPFAVVATLLATYVVLRWTTHSLKPKACQGSLLMDMTMVTWTISILIGITVYFAHLVG